MSDQAEVLRRVRKNLDQVLVTQSHYGFGAKQARRMVVSDLVLEGIELAPGGVGTVSKRGSKATVMVKLKLDKDCCNYHGNAHGGFLAYLIDVASSLPILALSNAETGSWTHSGVSSNINVYYLAAAPNGTEIQVVSTVIQIGKSTATVEARVEDVATGKLFALGTHVKVDVSRRAKL